MPDLHDPKVVNAIEAYVRLAVGAGLAIVLIYAFIANRIDEGALLRAIIALVTLDRGAIGAINFLRARND